MACIVSRSWGNYAFKMLSQFKGIECGAYFKKKRLVDTGICALGRVVAYVDLQLNFMNLVGALVKPCEQLNSTILVFCSCTGNFALEELS